jgi:hypothetical protein
MRIILTLAILATAVALAAPSRGASRGTFGTPSYSCEIRTNGGSCVCDSRAGAGDPMECAGMDEFCHARGVEVECDLDLDTGAQYCTCKWSFLRSGTISFFGGGYGMSLH